MGGKTFGHWLFAAGALTALVAGCGPLAHAELDAEDVCKEVLRQDVPAAPTEAEGTWIQREDMPIPRELRISDLSDTTTIELKRVEISVEGVENIGFARNVHVRAQLEPNGPLVDLGPAERVTPTVLRFTLAEPADVTPLMDRGKNHFEAELTATMPQQPWTIAVSACYRAAGEMDWSP